MELKISAIITILFILISKPAAGQNIGVVSVDSVEVKKERSAASKTIDVLVYGDEVSYVQIVGGWIVLLEGGYVPSSAVISKKTLALPPGDTAYTEEITKRLLLQQENVLPADSLELKSPEEYTEKELLYLILKTQQQNDEMSGNIKTIKNIQVFLLIVSIITFIGGATVARVAL